MSVPVRLCVIPTSDLRGLDPKKYVASIGVERIDDQPLTEAELAEIRAAFGVEAPAAKASSKPAGKGKARKPRAAE